MNHLLIINEDEQRLFRKSVADVKKLSQYAISTSHLQPKVKKIMKARILQEQLSSTFNFSDKYYLSLNDNDPVSYLCPGVNLSELKKLRRGKYSPDCFLDLHGLTQRESKRELDILITTCKREYIYCACVIHGHGKNILKRTLPHWLAQHPDILSFHQAPKVWGGNAAILVLIKLVK